MGVVRILLQPLPAPGEFLEVAARRPPSTIPSPFPVMPCLDISTVWSWAYFTNINRLSEYHDVIGGQWAFRESARLL